MYSSGAYPEWFVLCVSFIEKMHKIIKVVKSMVGTFFKIQGNLF